MCFFDNCNICHSHFTEKAYNIKGLFLVTLRFDYCNGLFCGKHGHITPVLEELHCSTVKKRIKCKIVLLVYTCLHGTAPSYLREMLKDYAPPRTLRSTSKNLLCEARTNMKTYGDRSIGVCAPKLWN